MYNVLVLFVDVGVGVGVAFSLYLLKTFIFVYLVSVDYSPAMTGHESYKGLLQVLNKLTYVLTPRLTSGV